MKGGNNTNEKVESITFTAPLAHETGLICTGAWSHQGRETRMTRSDEVKQEDLPTPNYLRGHEVKLED